MTFDDLPLPVVGGAALLSLGLLLGAFGLLLILYSARMTRLAISKRVELVRGNETVMRVLVQPNLDPLVRRPSKSGSVKLQREAARVMGRFGVRPAQVERAWLALRVCLALVLAGAGYMASTVLFDHAMFNLLAPVCMVAGAAAGWMLPGMYLDRRILRRANAVVSGLPDALELLVISVEAGLSFEDGLDRIVAMLQKAQPELASELALTSADLKILPSRDIALANLAERIDAPSVRSVVTTLAQTMRYGTPLAQALRLVANELRNDSLARLEERANQLPSLMTVPMMIFIMPTIFLIVGGPAVIRILDSFK